mgnify:CR=1 FL=1
MAKQIVDVNGAPAIELKFDDQLAKQFGELTGNHLQQQLAIVVDGTVRLAPYVRAPITRSVHITGNFSEEEVQEVVEKLKPALSQPDPSPIGIDMDLDSASLQGIWADGIAKNGKSNPDTLIIFYQNFYYHLSDPATLEQYGRFSVDSSRLPKEIILSNIIRSLSLCVSRSSLTDG